MVMANQMNKYMTWNQIYLSCVLILPNEYELAQALIFTLFTPATKQSSCTSNSVVLSKLCHFSPVTFIRSGQDWVNSFPRRTTGAIRAKECCYLDYFLCRELIILEQAYYVSSLDLLRHFLYFLGSTFCVLFLIWPSLTAFPGVVWMLSAHSTPKETADQERTT